MISRFVRLATKDLVTAPNAKTNSITLTQNMAAAEGQGVAEHDGRDVYVENQNDLSNLNPPIRKLLFAEFDVGASINRFCPAMLDDGCVAIVVVEGWRDSDQVDELIRQVRRRYVLANPARIVVPTPLLLALVRGQVAGTSFEGAGGGTEGQRSSLVEAFHELVEWGVVHEASDLHINIHRRCASSEVKYTVDGRYVTPARFANMPTATLLEMLAVAWMDVRGGNGAVFDPQIEQQGRLELEIAGKPIMLRWASLATDAGPSVCLRILRLESRAAVQLEELGYLPQQVATLERARRTEGGITVLAGAVGSGKSTTIATLMSMISPYRKVITLEDPVEYLIDGALQNTITRSLDGETRDVFQAKLRTVKRSAMNDLLVGEIRDRETGRALMDLAGSGVSVYTTVHAANAMLIPERLASDFIGVSRDFLATPGILKLLVYQALLPRLCPQCALQPANEHAAAAYYANVLKRLFSVNTAGLRFRNPLGCARCQEGALPELYGYCGRTVVAEMIEPGNDDEFLCNVRHGDTIQQRRYLAQQHRSRIDEPDMKNKTALECAIYKALQGDVDPRDVEARFQPFETLASLDVTPSKHLRMIQ